MKQPVVCWTDPTHIKLVSRQGVYIDNMGISNVLHEFRVVIYLFEIILIAILNPHFIFKHPKVTTYGKQGADGSSYPSAWLAKLTPSLEMDYNLH